MNSHYGLQGEDYLRKSEARSISENLMDNAIETIVSGSWLTLPGLVVLGVSGLFLLQGAWSGWKQGFPRKLAALFLLAGTSYGAWHFRGDIATLLESRIHVPRLALELAVFFYAFLISYLVLLAIAYCAFKKTKDIKGGQSFGYGVGGAVLGFTTNLGILVLAAVSSKYAHEFFHAWQQVEGKPAVTEQTTTETPANPVPRWVEYIGGALGFVQQTPLKEIVADIEPIDTQTFRIGSKLTFFTRTRKARNLFFQRPEARQLQHSPKVRELLGDPELIRLANQGKWQQLGNQKAVLDVLSDPSAWEGIDLDRIEAAIDRAITEANRTTGTAPSAKPNPVLKKVPDTPEDRTTTQKNLSAVE